MPVSADVCDTLKATHLYLSSSDLRKHVTDYMTVSVQRNFHQVRKGRVSCGNVWFMTNILVRRNQKILDCKQRERSSWHSTQGDHQVPCLLPAGRCWIGLGSNPAGLELSHSAMVYLTMHWLWIALGIKWTRPKPTSHGHAADEYGG